MKSQLAVLLIVLCTHLVVHAQDGSTDVAPPEEMGDADSLDGLDQSKAPSATVPEYQDVTKEAPAPKKAKKAKKKAYHEPESTVTGNDPDVQRENRYHEIYQKFNAEPTAIEAWDKAVGDRKAEVYRVQKGDTLWDISSTFFADPQFWPKIWALNKEGITNPHQINPAMNIQFFPGSMNDVPTIGLAQNDVEGEQDSMVDATPEPAAAALGDVVMPKGRRRTPLLKQLPNSLPRYRNEIVDRPPAQMQIDLPKNQFPRPVEYLTFYVNDEPIKGVGAVTETESVLGSAGEFQYIFVHLNEGNVKNYTVQKNIDVVLDPLQKGRKGHMVEIQGEIEVLESVNPAKNIYRARVKKNLQLVEVGSFLVPGQLPVIQPKASSITSGVAARIMGGSYWGNRKLFGSDGIVFLDAGSTKGFQDGQTLNIYADQSLRNGKTEAMINDRVIGTVKVVRVTPNFSTAYVLTSSLDIVTGDSVGQPRTQASNGAPPPHVEASPSETNFDLDMDNSPVPPPSEPDTGVSEDDLQL